LRSLFKDVALALKDEAERKQRLQDFYLKVHLLATTAAPTPYTGITQVATVFEKLLSVLVENPAQVTASVLRTLASLVDCMEQLFQRAGAGETRQGAPPQARVLVVDDDPSSNRLVVSALADAKLQARTTEDPSVAWEWLQQEPYDLFLLDIEMPGLGGFELCKRLRGLPRYQKTPVIFVTAHGDFAHRAKSTLSGGDDLVAKPILPAELAAKVLLHVVRRQMAA
jgi:CheY-like chemotaxis protein